MVIMMFGGLHIEMAALKSVGSLLQDSGWTSALVEAGIASSGTAESYLSASSVTRTRQAHQITACCLYKLRKSAYASYSRDASQSSEDVLSFEEWCKKRRLESPQFAFWSLILDIELTILTLIRSFREADFVLYREALSELIPYFFANNNINYARWLPIHLRDMMSIEQQHPQVAREFHKGNFVVHKTCREFSAISIDQAHEQNNAVIKDDGGAVGFIEDPAALRRWMVSGPEVSRLVGCYEELSGAKDGTNNTKHHEQSGSVQSKFFAKVGQLFITFQEMGNPFQEESADLLVLDTKDIADPVTSKLVITHHERGKDQLNCFIKGLQKDGDSSFNQPIKKNKISFFKQEEVVTSSKEKALKEDCNLFSRLNQSSLQKWGNSS